MKISIITVNYNNAAGLLDTIKSVLKQSYEKIEFIVIDGLSNDESKDILKSYSDKIDYWISEADNGIFSAMNKGIERATGDYLYFLNSGDTLVDENTLSNLSGYLEEPYELIFGNIILSDGKSMKERTYPSKLKYSFLLSRAICHQCIFIAKSVFSKVGHFDIRNKYTADRIHFLNSIVKHQCSYKYVNIPIAIYDTHGVTSQPQNYDIIKEEFCSYVKKHYSLFYEDYKHYQELKIFYSKLYKKGIVPFYIKLGKIKYTLKNILMRIAG